MRPPIGTYIRIAPRSGLSMEHSIDVGAGVVDQDYTREIKVVLCNNGQKDFEVKRGDCIAHIIVEKFLTPKIQLVPELVDTERGNAKFRHTGINLIEEMGEDFVGIEQIWPYEGPRVDRGEERMTLCVGKSHFLKPLE